MAIAYFSTWTTYGTWLPGDDRFWYQRGKGIQPPDFMRKLEASLLLMDAAVTLDAEQRRIVENTISDHCAIRSWTLHAVNCRSNHVHVVVTAPNRAIEIPREQFKAWCTRKLKEYERLRNPDSKSPMRDNWWTERGWDEYIDGEEFLINSITYTRDGQDR